MQRLLDWYVGIFSFGGGGVRAGLQRREWERWESGLVGSREADDE
jgi:hypothetical protein